MLSAPDEIESSAEGDNPEHEIELADSVGLALLVVLETLAPAERVAFVLHDMFDLPFDEIAPIVGRSRDRGTATGQPRAAARAGNANATGCEPRAAKADRRGLPRRLARRRFRSVARGARSRRRVPRRSGRHAARLGKRDCAAHRPWPPLSSGVPSKRRPPSSTASSARSWRPAGNCFWCSASPLPTARSSGSTRSRTPNGWLNSTYPPVAAWRSTPIVAMPSVK